MKISVTLLTLLLLVSGHGCQKANTLAPTSNQSSGNTSEAQNIRESYFNPPKDWIPVRLKFFSFHLPSNLKSVKMVNDDSAVWRYDSNGLELTIDLGLYSGKPSGYESEPDYHEEMIDIDGKKAILTVFRFSRPVSDNRQYAAAVYFSNISLNETKLSFFVRGKTLNEQEIAKTIFRSIKFEVSSKGKD